MHDQKIVPLVYYAPYVQKEVFNLLVSMSCGWPASCHGVNGMLHAILRLLFVTLQLKCVVPTCVCQHVCASSQSNTL